MADFRKYLYALALVALLAGFIGSARANVPLHSAAISADRSPPQNVSVYKFPAEVSQSFWYGAQLNDTTEYDLLFPSTVTGDPQVWETPGFDTSIAIGNPSLDLDRLFRDNPRFGLFILSDHLLQNGESFVALLVDPPGTTGGHRITHVVQFHFHYDTADAWPADPMTLDARNAPKTLLDPVADRDDIPLYTLEVPATQTMLDRTTASSPARMVRPRVIATRQFLPRRI